MKNRGGRIFIGIIFLLFFLAALFSVRNYLRRRIPDNPETTLGNLPGNVYNGGLICESGGRVYFANPSDNNCLYSMNPDESDYRKLSSRNVRHINCAGNFLYYYMDSFRTSGEKGFGGILNQYGIYRSRLNGKDTNCIARVLAQSVQLCGNYVYYMENADNTGTLYKLRTTAREQEALLNDLITPASFAGGQLYYAGVQYDHNLHAVNVSANGASRVVMEGNFYQPIVADDGYVYYIDLDNAYRLTRRRLIGGDPEVLTEDSADFYNMNGSHIYYDCFSDQSLKRMRLDGSGQETLLSGVYNSIFLTSEYVYCREYGNDDRYIHIPISGNGMPAVFVPEVK